MIAVRLRRPERDYPAVASPLRRRRNNGRLRRSQGGQGDGSTSVGGTHLDLQPDARGVNLSGASSGAVRDYARDRLGSVRNLVSTTQTLSRPLSYEPWGASCNPANATDWSGPIEVFAYAFGAIGGSMMAETGGLLLTCARC